LLPPQEVVEFFSQLDGFSLWWMHINNPRYNKTKFDKYGTNFDMAATDACDGFISIEHLRNILDPDMRLGTIIDDAYDGKKEEFLGRNQDSITVRNKLWHFDYFDYSSSENTVLIHFANDQIPFVLLPSDDYATLSETRYISFESYIEFLIWSKGLKRTRYEFFKKKNDFVRVESLNKEYFDALPPIDIDNLY
jgi:hypothetical protein